MLVDVTVRHLSSLNYILVSLFFFIYTFLDIFASVPLPVFSLDFVHPPSFLVGLYGVFLLLLLFCPFFTLVALSVPCVRHIIFVTFVYCDIVERCHILKSSSIYSNPCKAATKVLLHPVLFFFF